MGELFLGCPAIVPASAPLIEKHEKESKQAKGAGDRANSAAAVDTAAASMGSIGLLAFALIGSTSLRVALRRYSCVRNICLVLDINTMWILRRVICHPATSATLRKFASK